MKHLAFYSLAILMFAASGLAQDRPTAFINARIIPIVGASIEQGVLVIRNGKITAICDARAVRLSSDVVTVDMAGKTIMPGLVDTHSHTGSPAGADGAAPIQPDVRIL